jgi:hypothetical protein
MDQFTKLYNSIDLLRLSISMVALSSILSVPLALLDFSTPRNNFSPDESIFINSHGADIQNVIY